MIAHFLLFTELSAVGSGGVISDTPSFDPFLLDDDDTYDDPFLMWGGLHANSTADYTTGIT